MDQALLPGLVTKPIQRISKCSGGIATLVRGHQLRFKFQPEVRQLGSNGTTSGRQIGLQIDDAVGGDGIGDPLDLDVPKLLTVD